MFKRSTLPSPSLRTSFIGVDMGDRLSHVAIFDDQGALIAESRLSTSQAAFGHNFAGLPVSRIAMEVGAHSQWVVVARARKLRAIYHNPPKATGSMPRRWPGWRVWIQHCCRPFTTALPRHRQI